MDSMRCVVVKETVAERVRKGASGGEYMGREARATKPGEISENGRITRTVVGETERGGREFELVTGTDDI